MKYLVFLIQYKIMSQDNVKIDTRFIKVNKNGN